MSRLAAAVAALLGLALVGVVGLVLAVGTRWGPFAREIAFGEDEVISADPTIVLDGSLDVVGSAIEPCADISMPMPEDYLGAVATSLPSRAYPDSTGETRVRLGPMSWLLVVCLGSVDEVGSPEQIVTEHRTDAEFAGTFPVQAPPVRVAGPFGEAIRWSGAFTASSDGRVLTDWYIEHDDTVLAIGYLRPSTEKGRMALVESMIAGLSWDG